MITPIIVLFLVSITAGGLVPLAVALQRQRTRARLWIGAGFLINFLADLLGVWLAIHRTNNLWIDYFASPLTGACVLVGLSQWQLTAPERITIRVTIPFYLAVRLFVALRLEDLTNFSRFASPLDAVVLLTVALWTLLRRSFGPATRAHQTTDWFWTCIGLAGYAIALAAYEPAALLAGDDRAALVLIFSLRSILFMFSYLTIAWGMSRPWTPRRSKRSSSSLPSA